MSSVLVTGVSGFVGKHLVEFLRREHPEVELFGLVRPGKDRGLPEGVRLVEADLEDRGSVEAAFGSLQPDNIVHLAGQSSAHRSWLDPEGTLRTNLLGLLHLLEVVRTRSLCPRILVVGSAEEYGHIDPKDLPLKEEAPLRPHSPYATSKVAQGYLALQYCLSYGMHIISTRSFPHTGPGRGIAFAESSFARQIAEIEGGRHAPVLEVGNLEAVRDFTDVRDVVRAYWALLAQGEPGRVYNVCSGSGVSIRELLGKLLSSADIEVEVRLDEKRLRPSDIPILVGDPSRLEKRTGWSPRIPLDRTLGEILNYWRDQASIPAHPNAT